MHRARYAAVAAATVMLCTFLVGCDSEANDTVPMPVPVPTTSVTPGASPSAAPPKASEADPKLLVGGTALANLDYFNFVNNRLLAVNSNPSSSAIIENLINAGFAKEDLEVTPDKTELLGRHADSIQFAVRTSKDCLVGQFRAGAYSSVIGPPVNGEICLVGETQTNP